MNLKRTIITCVSVSPMFMFGAYNKEGRPELRSQSIKGVMRYFWRAVQGADNISKLRQEEGKLFGTASGSAQGGKSQISEMKILIQPENKQVNAATPKRYDLLPHRKGRGDTRQTTALAKNTSFKVIISSRCDDKTHKNFVKLFVLTTMLGGFGQRSRKGMGTVNITYIDGDLADVSTDCSLINILELLNSISVLGNATYNLISEQNKIEATTKKTPGQYPYIESIMLSQKKYDDIDKIPLLIGEASHDIKEKKPHITFIGVAKTKYKEKTKDKEKSKDKENPRLASPTICSSIKNQDSGYSIIVTCVNNTMLLRKSPKAMEEKELQNQYIQRLMR